jgi:hypothetical protein
MKLSLLVEELNVLLGLDEVVVMGLLLWKTFVTEEVFLGQQALVIEEIQLVEETAVVAEAGVIETEDKVVKLCW